MIELTPPIKYPWTLEEEEIVKLHYSSLGPKGLCELLPNRTYCSIQSKAVKLGVQPKRTKIEDYTRVYKLQTKYNITIDEYDKLFESQNGCCAVCGNIEKQKHQNGAVLRLSVDHNHKTGQVRGLLCRSCNLMLGSAQEEISTLMSAIKYLEEHNCD